MSSSNTIKEASGDRLFLLSIYIGLTIILVIVGYPLLYILSSSFSSSAAVWSGRVWLWPVEPTLHGYEAVFRYPQVWVGFRNSLLYTSLGTLVSVMLTIMMAYPISRRALKGRGTIIALLLFAMVFNGGLIPFYMVVKNLGMLNSMWAMIIPGALNIFSVIVAKTFFQQTIPNELHEAAQMDGCSDTRFLVQIVIPLSKPVIAVLALWSAVGQWNAYFNALIFLSGKDLYPLQLVLREILVLQNIQMGALDLSPEQIKRFQEMKTLLKYSIIVLTCIPIVLLYPFIQRYFVKGVMIGSVKE